MPKKIDLSNLTFGDWTILREATKEEKENKSGAYWLCKCSCGTEKIVNGQLLRNGSSKSCGCKSAERIRQANYNRAENLIGKQYGRLTVIERVININKKGTYWKCKCECGNETIVERDSLIRGKTKSCGCLRKETSSKHLSELRKNDYIDETGNTYGKLTVLYKVDNNHSTRAGAIWHCKCECGNEKDVFGMDLRQGIVSSCGCLGKSKGEWTIEKILKENNIKYKREFTQQINNKNMRFDFIIYKNNTFYFIEFDGEQHLKPSDLFGGEPYLKYIQEHDKFKNQYCKDNNIPLIRIPYTHLNNLCINDLLLETSQFIVK